MFVRPAALAGEGRWCCCWDCVSIEVVMSRERETTRPSLPSHFGFGRRGSTADGVAKRPREGAGAHGKVLVAPACQAGVCRLASCLSSRDETTGGNTKTVEPHGKPTSSKQTGAARAIGRAMPVETQVGKRKALDRERPGSLEREADGLGWRAAVECSSGPGLHHLYGSFVSEARRGSRPGAAVSETGGRKPKERERMREMWERGCEDGMGVSGGQCEAKRGSEHGYNWELRFSETGTGD